MPPYFFKPGEKVDTAAYYKVLRYLCYLCSSLHTPPNYTWTQDGAHHQESPGFLSCQHGRFLARRHVSNSSPDLNSLDFLFGALGRVMPARLSHKFDVATASHCRGLGQLDRGVYQEDCASVRRRVEAVSANNGGHIE
ncbi:Uncharacterized protein FKW44_006714 [Caligus rogercresseyi]|uniref:Uncharacterized protein n=1 Tax=Caligus rogercresseyi TaxID=217165 RepID=A0A7T8KDQ4_CALRO|nr:Uncharacterized protein FKW44_006714 [Caligus rogercresseyi]